MCGEVQFAVKGSVIFNELCHCRACSWARGCSPVHLIGVQDPGFTVTKGQELVKEVKGKGQMLHQFCSACGSFICQSPEGEPFKAVMPTSFHIVGADGVSCLLPLELLPKHHVNYENRQMNWSDDLPKYKTFDSSPRLDNSGNPLA